MHAWGRTAILLSIAGLAPASADSEKPVAPPAPPPQEQLTLEKFGEANKACLQWTDGCAICLRHADGSFGCSLTGIACQPSSLTCRQIAQGQKPAGGSGQPAK